MTQLVEIDSGDPDIGQVDRPLYSTDDRKLTLEPEGQGVVQGVQRDLPIILQHDFEVYLSNGHYSGEGPAVHLGPTFVKGEADFKIQGNKDDRGAVTLDAGINATFFGKPEHIEFQSLTLNGLTQACGQAWFQNCDIDGFGNAAVSSKGGMTAYYQCDIGDGSTPYAAYPNMVQMDYYRGCTLRGDEQAINAPMGAATIVEWTELGSSTPRASDDHQRLKDGVYFGGRRLAFDD